MWPWEHLAFAYLLLSAWTRLRRGRPPDDDAALALAVGSQFPDLVDKPLAWGLGVLPSGLSLGHSVLFAVPLAAALTALAARRGRAPVGVAFGVGHLSHILGDGLYALVLGGSVSPGYALWPLVPARPETGPFFGTVAAFWTEFLAFLGTPRGQLYLALEAAFLLTVLGLWVADGAPGLGRLRAPRDGEAARR